VPAGLDPAAAETVVVNGITAWQMLHRKARVRSGQTILVHGANGRHAYFYNIWAGRGLARRRFRARLRHDLTQVLQAMAAGHITAQVAARFPLARAADALRLAESGTVAGKVVLSP
jgi:NADPH:quinone reductase-like Zn-dependent oxidoreductase